MKRKTTDTFIFEAVFDFILIFKGAHIVLVELLYYIILIVFFCGRLLDCVCTSDYNNKATKYYGIINKLQRQ